MKSHITGMAVPDFTIEEYRIMMALLLEDLGKALDIPMQDVINRYAAETKAIYEAGDFKMVHSVHKTAEEALASAEFEKVQWEKDRKGSVDPLEVL